MSDHDEEDEDPGIAAIRSEASLYRRSAQYADHQARGLCTLHAGRRGDGTWRVCTRKSHVANAEWPPRHEFP